MLADDLGNVLPALAGLVDLLDELDRLVDAGMDVAHFALNRLAASGYQRLLGHGLVGRAGHFLALRREDNVVGPLLLQTRQGGRCLLFAQGQHLVENALGGGFDRFGVTLAGLLLQDRLGLVRGGGSGDAVDLVFSVSGLLQIGLVADVVGPAGHFAVGQGTDTHKGKRQEGDKLHSQFPRHPLYALGPIVVGHVLVEGGGDGLDKGEGGVLHNLLHVLLGHDSGPTNGDAGDVPLVGVLQAFD